VKVTCDLCKWGLIEACFFSCNGGGGGGDDDGGGGGFMFRVALNSVSWVFFELISSRFC